jgi:NnrS protein
MPHDFRYRRQLIALEPHVQQHAQRVVGMEREAHFPSIWRWSVLGVNSTWRAKLQRTMTAIPRFDRLVLAGTAVALAVWTVAPEAVATPWVLAAAGFAIALRLSRWRGLHTGREALLLILHIGYAWLPLGLLLLGVNGIFDMVPLAAALHALTVGAIGTMTLAVMTRASLGHTGHALSAGQVTKAAYSLVTIAAVLLARSIERPDGLRPTASNFFPIGWPQLAAAYEHGLAYARSVPFTIRRCSGSGCAYLRDVTQTAGIAAGD